MTLVTVQSTQGLRASYLMAPAQLSAQVREILCCQRVRAIKTGALGSADHVRAVERLLRELAPRTPLVIDPVLGATRARRGARLFDAAAVGRLRRLMARAALVTPNAVEAGVLAGMSVRTLEEAAAAGRLLLETGARAVLVKGGHLSTEEATDVLVIGNRVIYLSSPRFSTGAHGTGCRLASLVAGRMATRSQVLTDAAIIQAVRWAKARMTESLRSPRRVGKGMLVLGP